MNDRSLKYWKPVLKEVDAALAQILLYSGSCNKFRAFSLRRWGKAGCGLQAGNNLSSQAVAKWYPIASYLPKADERVFLSYHLRHKNHN